jgi:hypothetical protein
MWRDTATEEQCSYDAARTMLERLLAGFKDDFPEDLLLGDVEMIRWDIQLLVAWMEKFLQAEANERQRLIQLVRCRAKAREPHAQQSPRHSRLDFHWN